MEVVEVRFPGHSRTEFVGLVSVADGYSVVRSPLFWPGQNMLVGPDGEIFSHRQPDWYPHKIDLDPGVPGSTKYLTAEVSVEPKPPTIPSPYDERG